MQYPICNSLVVRRAAERLSKTMLSTIPLPVIPNNTFVVTSYGAQGNGTTDDLTSIQNAINDQQRRRRYRGNTERQRWPCSATAWFRIAMDKKNNFPWTCSRSDVKKRRWAMSSR